VTARALAGGFVLCSLFRGDRTRFARLYRDRFRQVLEIDWFRPSSALLYAVDAAYPAVAGAEGSHVSCGSPGRRSIGHGYWRQTLRWKLARTPAGPPVEQVIQPLRRARAEWTNNVNWCGYADRADSSALYEGRAPHGFAHDQLSSVDWGSLAHVQGCKGAIACTQSYYDFDGRPTESDTRFNGAYRWTLHAGEGADIQSVAAHEFGHALQFDHVTNGKRDQNTNLMWPYLEQGDTSGRKLGRGDSIEDNLHY
jgi:hypothetical protein